MIGYDYNCPLLKWQKKKKEKNEIKHHKIIRHNQACHAGVFLGRIGLASLRLYIQKAIIDLELEWTVLEWKGWRGEGRVAVERMRAGVEGVGVGGEKSRRLHCHTPSPLSLSFFFLIVAHSIVKNLFSSPAFHCRNNQRWQQKFSPREYCANARKLRVQSDPFKCLPCNMEFTIGWLSDVRKFVQTNTWT